MNNLVDEYFKRDLTEAEEQQLADWLASSPEDSQHMARGLADMYAKSGLPEPVWPGGTLPAGKSTWWVLKPLAPLLMILAVIGFTAYRWLAHMPVSTPVEEPVASPTVEQAKKTLKKIHGASKAALPLLKRVPQPAHVAATIPALHSFIEGGQAPSAGLSVPAAHSLGEGRPLLPSNPAAQPQGHIYQQMSVVLDQATEGLVTVKVLDNLNTEVRTLYAGILPAGKKTFSWDGKTELGAVAPAGTYFIEVKSGQNIMRREVKVEGDAIP